MMKIETYKKATDLLNERDYCREKLISINTVMGKLQSGDEMSKVDISDARMLSLPKKFVESMLRYAMDYYTEKMLKAEKEFEEL